MSQEFLTNCDMCIHDDECPCQWHINNAACLTIQKNIKYRGAWEYLEMCLVKGLDIPGEVLKILYELVENYYSNECKP